MDYSGAFKGIKRVFIGITTYILSSLASIIFLIVFSIPAVKGNLNALLAYLIIFIIISSLQIVGYILMIWGLNIAGKDETYFENGFWVALLTVVLKLGALLLNSFLPAATILYSSFDAIGDICSVVVIVFIVNGLSVVLEKTENYDISDRGISLSYLVIFSYIVSILLTFIPSFFKTTNPSLLIVFQIFQVLSSAIELFIYLAVITYLYRSIQLLKPLYEVKKVKKKRTY